MDRFSGMQGVNVNYGDEVTIIVSLANSTGSFHITTPAIDATFLLDGVNDTFHTAMWAEEDVTTGDSALSPLLDFGTVEFDNCQAQAEGVTLSLDGATVLSMVDSKDSTHTIATGEIVSSSIVRATYLG